MLGRIGVGSIFQISAMILFLLVAIHHAGAKEIPAEARPMDFIVVRDGDCLHTCIRWISAAGMFERDTPQKLKALLRKLKGEKLPVIFQSYGGNVDGAVSVGQMIRSAGLETAVGRTILDDCPMLSPRCVEKINRNGTSVGKVRAGAGYCFSACPLALAGGVTRTSAKNANIGFHQITTGHKDEYYGTVGRRNLDAIATSSDKKIKKLLAAYLRKMGVNSQDVFAMMGLASPDGLYYVQSPEALKSGIITKLFADTEEPGRVFVASHQ